MQTIYAFSYNPAIATGTNTTGTNWRMAYQQSIMLYKGTANTIKIVVFATNQRVVNLTNYNVQIQIVDKETEEHFVTKLANITAPTSGVASITLTEQDLRNLQHRFYHIIARLLTDDGSSINAGEILYLDDNYGVFTPVTIENAWNYSPGTISTIEGPLLNIGNVIPLSNNNYWLGNVTNRWGHLYATTANIANLEITDNQLKAINDRSVKFVADSQTLSFVDNSTDPIHMQGDGGFVLFNDSTHTNDGPRLEVWYGEQGNPNDPAGQHSLDIRAAANSYVELASNDLNSFIGVDDTGPFVQTQWQNNPSKAWRFLGDGELRLPSVGSRITSEDGQLSIVMTYNDIRLTRTALDGATHTTLFDATGNVFFDGNVLPGISNALSDPTSIHSLGSPTHPWKDIYLSNNTIYLGNVALSVDNTGNLTVNGNAIVGGGISTVLPYIDLTNDPFIFNTYIGQEVSFTKDDYGNQVDNIDTNLAITRLNNKGIYNPFLEADWDDTSSDGVSPAGTLWNKDGWSDLTNLDQRTYLSFYETFLRFGNNVLTAEAVMKDVANNKYYKFDFIIWGNANQGAPVSYIRTRLDPVTGSPIGDPVIFSKAGYTDPTQVNDPIDAGLTITRGNNQSIYNIALETSYSTLGDGQDSPEGTEWNGDGWGTLRDVTTRSYSTFKEILNNAIGENIVNKELVMHDMINDKYYAIKFLTWTQNNQGGGFSYTRRRINTNNIFVKPDNDNVTKDIFVADNGSGNGIAIARKQNNGIYNPYREEGWDQNTSPGGTLWNTEGWEDLSNITTRTYQSFYDAFGGNLGNKVPGSKTIMYIPDTNQYFAIHWLSWTQSGGGGFSYYRYELDVTKLSEGITFADGTILKSAEGLGKVKSIASNGRRIEEVSGDITVSVTTITTTNITSAASRSVVGDNRIWVADPAIATVMDNYGAAGITDATTIQFSTDNINWYTFSGSTSYQSAERGYSCWPQTFTYNQGDTIYFRYNSGGTPQVWWDKNKLPSGGNGFRGAVIDFHALTGDGTFIGTIHIAADNNDNLITHTEVKSGYINGMANDDLWHVPNEGKISYRRTDGAARTAKIHWTAKVFYGNETWD